MDLTPAEKAILKTLAHFDVLDYPLTLLEIARFNGIGLSAEEILKALESGLLAKLIIHKQGLYFLKGRETLIPLRLGRYRLALKKLRRSRRFAALLSFFPWIRAVAVYSSLSLKNSRATGDIDLFFISAAGRAWSARFCLNFFLKLFRLRPTDCDSRDKLCASYIADEDNLDLSIANYDDDFFYAYGCAAFLFLAGAEKTIKDFWLANGWIKEILPDWQPAETAQTEKYKWLWQKLQTLAENILGLIPENRYHDWQIKILPPKYPAGNDGKKIILGPGLIKLHDNDKRGKYNKLFAENLKRIMDYG